MAAETANLTYFGRSTVKIVTAGNFVMYLDPYAEGDYSQKADLVLVTHGHSDHNCVGKVTRKASAIVAAPKDAVDVPGYRAVKEGDEFDAGPIRIRVVPAYNKNHKRTNSVGYLVSFDGITVYHAGDTSFIPEMQELASASIDYALLPTDGQWNMGGEEAGKCSDAIKPRFVAAIHSSPTGLYDRSRAGKLARSNAIPLEPGKTIALQKR